MTLVFFIILKEANEPPYLLYDSRIRFSVLFLSSIFFAASLKFTRTKNKKIKKKVKFLQFRRNLISLTITFKYLTGNTSFCESSLEGGGEPAVAISEILWSDGLPLQMHTIRYSLVTFLMKYVFLKHSHLIMHFVS